jgi:hypothetical protein
MTITLDIKPEVQAELARQAAASGLRTRGYMRRVYSKRRCIFLPASGTTCNRAGWGKAWLLFVR